MSDNKEQSVAALNTLINLALQVANTQQAQVLELGPANEAREEEEGPTMCNDGLIRPATGMRCGGSYFSFLAKIIKPTTDPTNRVASP